MMIAEFLLKQPQIICKKVAAMKQQHGSCIGTGDNWKFIQNILFHGSCLESVYHPRAYFQV